MLFLTPSFFTSFYESFRSSFRYLFLHESSLKPYQEQESCPFYVLPLQPALGPVVRVPLHISDAYPQMKSLTSCELF